MQITHSGTPTSSLVSIFRTPKFQNKRIETLFHLAPAAKCLMCPSPHHLCDHAFHFRPTNVYALTSCGHQETQLARKQPPDLFRLIDHHTGLRNNMLISTYRIHSTPKLMHQLHAFSDIFLCPSVRLQVTPANSPIPRHRPRHSQVFHSMYIASPYHLAITTRCNTTFRPI